jgi:hypothetical protein
MRSVFANLLASSRKLGTVDAVDVCLVDGSGNQVTNFGGSGGTSSNFGAAFPGSGTAAGASDGSLMQPLLVDASGFLKVNVAAGSGGNGAASNTGAAVPAQADYQGVNVGGNLRGAVGFDVDTGAGTEFVQGVSLRKAASGGSVEAGTSTDPLRTDPTGTTTQPVSATNLDVALSTRLSESDFDTKTGSLTEAAPASDTASSGLNGRLQRLAQRLTSMIAQLPAALTGGGNFKISLTEAPAIAVSATVTSVADSNANQTLLSSNTSRKSYELYNDSTQIAYVKKGTTATTSDYSFQMLPGDYYCDSGLACYTGRVDCIWAADASGAMKVTEDT